MVYSWDDVYHRSRVDVLPKAVDGAWHLRSRWVTCMHDRHRHPLLMFPRHVCAGGQRPQILVHCFIKLWNVMLLSVGHQGCHAASSCALLGI
jgi:hypothetical protein